MLPTAPTVQFVLSALERPLIEEMLLEDTARLRYPTLVQAIVNSDHPTVSLSRQDAEEFCEWLTGRAAMMSQSSAVDDHQRSGVLKSAAFAVRSALLAD
jgi:hypothetical protein